MDNLGKIHIYTGNGKGKTTSALGLALRANSSGFRVIIIYFDKSRDNCTEYIGLDKLGIDYKFFGINRIFDNKFRFGYNDSDIGEISKAWSFVKSIILSSEYDLIVLDEIINCLDYIDMKELESVLKSNNKSELVLTGRNAPDNIIELADLVTENLEIKHYFQKKYPARKGIEY
ncbi:MAG: cob(I)yrinic acid a,c-diamide adenosyltransferase [Patescibacteria group bacterium]|nr:cob(I)yrinic acid a,c-diamide adenosyltransferase [Patescibacteria group bacterium]MDD4304099.1 cob(I)yrinic acid a,c-diamide adenosyltransferase [Patescibacteria group bacterium]MDD4694976.1 cob(I)yrinic acid a,c-diamide adenosyltransferase [Patescibacteria group bacterium]